MIILNNVRPFLHKNKGNQSFFAYEDVLKLHPDDYDITFSGPVLFLSSLNYPVIFTRKLDVQNILVNATWSYLVNS